MIVWLVLRHYKVYRNIKFIPIINTWWSFTSYIWQNWVWKSSILEALNTYFNDKEWKLNDYAEIKWLKKDAYISPIFLIKKEWFNFSNIDFLNDLSGYFWNLDTKSSWVSEKALIWSLISDLKKHYNKDEYFLFSLSIPWKTKDNKSKVSFEPFNNEIYKNALKSYTNSSKIAQDLFSYIKRTYSYIYIPVEPKVSEILSFESRELQSLITKDLWKEIDSILNKEVKTPSKNWRKQLVKSNVLNLINEELSWFINKIENSIEKVDSSYKFNSKKQNLTALDVREKIIESYFYSRILQKNNKWIYNLSSWEQRKALIDIVYSLLTMEWEKERKIIFAIDEPEASMHLSRCLSQFERLYELSNDNQIILTTHWYWFLPIFGNWQFYYIDKENEDNINLIKFIFWEYFEELSKLPEDIEIKSIFDLVSSILNTLKDETIYNWIICEWVDDKTYLETILNWINNLKILSVWWKWNVKNIYKFLNPSISIKQEKKTLKWRVLCLIDTDNNTEIFDASWHDQKDNVIIRRLQLVKDQDWEKIKLLDLTNSHTSNQSRTVIEDCLIPKIYFESIKNVINNIWDEKIIEKFNMFEFNWKSTFSFLRWDDSVLKLKDIKWQEYKKEIVDYIEKNEVKYKISKEYKKLFLENTEKLKHESSFISEIKEYFKQKNKIN